VRGGTAAEGHLVGRLMDVYIAPQVAAVGDLYHDLLGTDRSTVEQLRLLAGRLADGHHARHPGAFVELANWHPGLVGSPAAELWSAALSEQDYLETVARGHGYPDWAAVVAAPTQPVPRFERCVDALLAGDRSTVAMSIAADPDLVTARSHWGHRATLLHYLAANGVEIHRQRVPRNAADLARLLLDSGADVAAQAQMYGAGRTTLGMLLTSSHPAHAGVADELAEVLRGAGAVLPAG
jgi:hypothetical protein